VALAVPPGEAETLRLADFAVVELVVGLNVTATVQVPFGGSAAAQVFAPIANCVESPPVSDVVSAPLAVPPVLVTVKVFDALVWPTVVSVNANVVGAIASAPAVMPVPVRLALTVPPGVPATASCADFAPVEVGVKSRTTLHEAAAASICPEHVLDTTDHSALSLPVSVWVSVPLAAPPEFVTTNVKLLLVFETTTDMKFCDDGVMPSVAGVLPVTVKLAAPPGEPVTANIADSAPAACGVNVTEIVHVAPAARVIPLQLSEDFVKSSTFVPDSAVESTPVASVPTRWTSCLEI
jgi:hypothetical protein